MPKPFKNVTGTPATPQFAEIVNTILMPTSNGAVRPCVNVYHFRQFTDPLLQTTKAQLMAAFKTALNASLAAALNTTAVAATSKCKFLDDPDDGYEDGANWSVGAVTGDRLPLFNSAVVQLKTGNSGRNWRGSKHFVPISESDTTLDELVGAAITRWTAVKTALEACNFIVPADASNWGLIVLSETLSDRSVNPSIFTGAYMTTCSLNLKIGTMKRRKERTAS